MENKKQLLKKYFKTVPNIAIAYSGGIDSTLLLHMAKKYGTQIKAYYVKSIFQTEEEVLKAEKTAKELNAQIDIIKVEVEKEKNIMQNGENRCYLCKKIIFTTIKEHAAKDGYTHIIDGTNASDNPQTRPGMKALTELGIFSPFAELGITKKEIREIAKSENLTNWNRPSNSCTATRILTATQITKELLSKTVKAESEIQKLGYKEIRIKNDGEKANLQISEKETQKAKVEKAQLITILEKYYKTAQIDNEPRKSE
ncbi:MAG: ATP-dependent sacrificial sulfur transferase LarE [Synergistaceae bacterium]